MGRETFKDFVATFQLPIFKNPFNANSKLLFDKYQEFMVQYKQSSKYLKASYNN